MTTSDEKKTKLKKKKAGAKLKLTPELLANFAKDLKVGTIRQACAANNIGESTYHEWVARGRGEHRTRKSNQVYAEFAEVVTVARTKGCLDRNRRIIAHGADDWRALAWMNKITDPATYSDQAVAKRAVEVKLQEVLSNVFWLMSPEAFQELEEAISTSTEYNLELGKMEELKAIEILMRTNYVPDEAIGQIGIAYLNFKKIVRDSIFSTNTINQESANEAVKAE